MKRILSKHNKWLIIAILLFITSLLIPIHTYDFIGLWLAIPISLLCAFFAFLFMTKVATLDGLPAVLKEFSKKHEGEKTEEDDDDEEEEDNNKLFIIVLTIIICIVGCISINVINNNRIESAIKNDGVFTQATIIDGARVVTTSRKIITNTVTNRYNTNKLKVQFKSSDGKIHGYTIKVEDDVFDVLAQDMKVEVKYLPEHPHIFRLIVGDKNVRAFKNIPNRSLRFNDITQILKLKQQDILPYLQLISQGWEETEIEGERVYLNSLKMESVNASTEDQVTAIFFNHFNSNLQSVIPQDKIINTTSLPDESNGEDGVFSSNTQILELDSFNVISRTALRHALSDKSINSTLYITVRPKELTPE